MKSSFAAPILITLTMLAAQAAEFPQGPYSH